MPSSIARTYRASELGPNTKLLCFDIETNGLHGQAFAVGAVLMAADGTIVSEFRGRCEIRGEIDAWVQAKVLPVIKDFEITARSEKALRQAFWQWYQEHEKEVDYVLVNNGYPVEYRFLIKCQEDNLDERYWDHPFPILELMSLLLPLGIKTQTQKREFAADIVASKKASSHNPHWDAWLTAAIAFKVLKQTSQL